MNPRRPLGAIAEWIGRRPRVVALATAAAVVAAGLVVVTVVGGGGDLRPGEARLRPDGRVEVSIDGAEFVRATDDMTIRDGDRVRVMHGRAVLDLPSGVTGELRAGSHIAVGGDDGAALSLERGDLLADVRRGTLALDGETAAVTVGAGTAKLRRSASLVVGVYEGSALVVGNGSSLSIPALRQAVVVGVGRIPDDVRPLALDDDDEWDRRFLGGVLELDRRLTAFGRGFEALVDDEVATPSLFRAILPALADAPLTEGLLAARSPGENLVGLTLVGMADGPFEERFERVFDLRDDGARWGLVAADLALDPPAVVDAVETAIDLAPLEIAAPEEAPGGGGGEPTSPTTTPPRDGTTTTRGPTGDDDGDDDDTTTTTGQLPILPGDDDDDDTTTTTCEGLGSVLPVLC